MKYNSPNKNPKKEEIEKYEEIKKKLNNNFGIDLDKDYDLRIN